MKEILERYSCRAYTGDALKENEIKAIADAALASPSGLNRQPWHIIIVTNKKLLDEMCAEGMQILKDKPDQTAYNRLMERGGTMFYNAPAMFLVATNVANMYNLSGVLHDNISMEAVDLGIVCQNIALAAQHLELGNVICAMAGITINGPNKDKWYAKLNIPQGFEFGMAVLVGKAKTTKPPHELDHSKISFV